MPDFLPSSIAKQKSVDPNLLIVLFVKNFIQTILFRKFLSDNLFPI